MRQSQLFAQPVAFRIDTLVVRVVKKDAYLLRGKVEALHTADIDVVIVEAGIVLPQIVGHITAVKRDNLLQGAEYRLYVVVAQS